MEKGGISMGYRAYLNIYLHEGKVHEDEKRYYEAYLNCNWDSTEEQQKLIELAKEVKHVWNENYDYMPNQMPSCQHVTLDGKSYYAPDSSFSQEEDLQYARKNNAPDSFLVLFSKEEYKDNFKGQTGKMYNCNKFYTTIDKALERLSKQEEVNGEMAFMKELLTFVPSDSLVELDVSEIIDNPDMFEPVQMEDIFRRMETLGRV
jgi:hypothetical protein